MDFIERMTDEMRATLLDKEELKNEFRFCMGKLLDAYEKSRLKLPATNEKGLPVVAGCFSLVGEAEKYWAARVRACINYLRRFLDRAEFWKLEDEYPGFNYSCMQSQKDIR